MNDERFKLNVCQLGYTDGKYVKESMLSVIINHQWGSKSQDVIALVVRSKV